MSNHFMRHRKKELDNDIKKEKVEKYREISLNLNQICEISKKLLKNNGVLGIVHRPERLLEILEIMKKNKIEPKKIRFIHPKRNSEANIVLIEGKKNAKSGIKILSPLISHKQTGEYTKEIKRYFN